MSAGTSTSVRWMGKKLGPFTGHQIRTIVFRKTIKLLPNAFEPRFLLGSAYNRLGRFQEALTELQAAHAGLESGFMMAQVTAASLVSENKVLAHPASVDSITTSGNKEDYVSMGMTASIKLKKIVENARNVLAIEAMAAAQALDFVAPLKTSKRGLVVYAAIRAVCPTMEKDRVMYPDFARIAEVIAAGKIAEALR